MPDQRLTFGAVNQRLRPEFHLGREGAGEPVVLTENLATFALEDYVVVGGVPQAGEPVSLGDAQVEGWSASSVPLDPRTLFPEAFAHWGAPQAGDFTNDGDFRRWWPINGTRDGDSPRLSMFVNPPPGSPLSPQGALVYAYQPASAPTLDPAYVYSGANGRRMDRPALVFETGKDGFSGYAKFDLETTLSSFTLAITAVFHPSRLEHAGIIEVTKVENAPVDQAPVKSPLWIRWDHGAVRMFADGPRLLEHETHRNAAQPVVIMLTVDGTEQQGRFYCLDSTRTTRTFSTAAIPDLRLVGTLGILGQQTDLQPFRYPAQMDLLDVVVWDTALDWADMEAKVNLLALGYGLVGLL